MVTSALIMEARYFAKVYAADDDGCTSTSALFIKLADAIEVSEALSKDYLGIAQTVEARMQAKLEVAEARAAKLEAALQWYAHEDTEAFRYTYVNGVTDGIADADDGKRARQALEDARG